MDNEKIKKVHLVFKTHLDIGFTGLSGNVIRRYFEDFIPAALDTARRSRDSTERFVWTTGSWLIYEFLEQSSVSWRRRMEEAVQCGDIRWHALPATTHTELMDASLFEFGVSLAEELDARFGRKSIAAKMTDVPGHTIGIVPILARHGVTFLHLGVNAGARCPEVPAGVFRWRESEGQELLVAYSSDYGSTVRLEDFDEMLYFSHTLDNLGPSSEHEVSQTFRKLRRQYPHAEIVTDTGLDGFAAALEKMRPSLPVCTKEIGDTWIYGAGSDPGKTAEFRALQRWRTKQLKLEPMLAKDPRWKEFSRLLLMVAEHTWGRDTKDQLQEKLPDGRPGYVTDETMETAAFLRARRWGRYYEREASWQEQRDYLKSAAGALQDLPIATDIADIRNDLKVESWTDPTGWPKFDPASLHETEHFHVRFDTETGALIHLEDKSNGRNWADPDHPWGNVAYEVFDALSYERYFEQYIRDLAVNDNWVWYDYGKPGLNHLQDHRAKKWKLKPSAFTRTETDKAICFSLWLFPSDEASKRYGCPRSICKIYRFPADAKSPIAIEVRWSEKQACRIPEVIWFSLAPRVINHDQWTMSKLGRLVSPMDVVFQGGRRMHGMERVEHPEVCIFPLDAPIVSPGAPRLLDFGQDQPDLTGGWHFPLANNAWGTNFPQMV